MQDPLQCALPAVKEAVYFASLLIIATSPEAIVWRITAPLETHLIFIIIIFLWTVRKGRPITIRKKRGTR